MKSALFVVVLAVVASVYATIGLDLSYFQGDVSQASWSCLAQNHGFAIIQGTAGSTPYVNPYIVNDLTRAHAAGFRYVDIYLFLNFHAGNPAGQVNNVLNFIQSHGAGSYYSQVWLDVEAASLWGSCAQNQVFIRAAVAEIERHGRRAGIYANWNTWKEIMCNTNEFARLPIWYPHYDNNPSFSDFIPFGGWSRPNIKQFRGTTGACGTSIDSNFY